MKQTILEIIAEVDDETTRKLCDRVEFALRDYDELLEKFRTISATFTDSEDDYASCIRLAHDCLEKAGF